jgi:hypothetical protein
MNRREFLAISCRQYGGVVRCGHVAVAARSYGTTAGHWIH